MNQEEKARRFYSQFKCDFNRIESLKNIKTISCGQNYSYALDNENLVYAWGSGENFVLGNGKEMDGDELVPRQINSKFFKE